nr:MAG TPA: hypothetical protein [Caudoviricetes sp.]
MTTFSLSFFTFRIYFNDHYGKEMNADLNNLNISNNFNYLEANDFNNLLINFSNSYTNKYSKNIEDSKIFRINKSNIINENQCNYVFMDTKSGKYGLESELVDIDSNKIVYKKSKKIADTKKFRLLFCTPKIPCEIGIVVFENISGFGIKNIFEEEFKTYINSLIKKFKKNNKNVNCYKINIQIKNILPISVINNYLENQNLKKIIFVQYSKYIDKSKNSDKNRGIKAEIKELVYKRPYDVSNILNNTKRSLKKYNNSIKFNFSKKEIQDIITIEDFDFDNIKYEIEVNNQKKTIDLENIHKLKLSENITNFVKLGEDGYPSEYSLIDIMKEDANYYLKEIGLIKKGD